MSNGWDPSLVDFTAPPDGRITLSAGGSSGNLNLLNGQLLAFPWRRQEEIANTFPGTIRVYDISNAEFMEIASPTLVGGANYARIYLAGYTDGTASVGMESSGAGLLTVSPNLIDMIATTVQVRGTNANFGGTNVSITPTAAVNIIPGTTFYMQSTTSTQIEATTTLQMTAVGNMTIASDANMSIFTSGVGDDISIQAGGNLTLTSAAGSVDMVALVGAWVTTFTPVVTQGVNVTFTTPPTHSRYTKVGRTVTWTFHLAITSTGTAGSTVTISLPFTATYAGNRAIGTGQAAAPGNVIGAAVTNTTTTIAIIVHGAGGFFNTQLVSGHALFGTVTYEATT